MKPLLRRKVQLCCVLLVSIAFDLKAEPPRPDALSFFKQSVGTWKGKGTSVVGPNKSKLEVVDEWKADFAMEGAAFVQVGMVKLSNGNTFQYRWVYRVDPKIQKLVALYTDSKNARNFFLVQLADDQQKLSVTPVDATGAPVKPGLFSTVYFKGTGLTYDAEVRDAEGKPIIQTTVSAAKESEKPGAAP
jgi:hypothetical protein